MEGTRASVCLGVGGEMGSGRVDFLPSAAASLSRSTLSLLFSQPQP